MNNSEENVSLQSQKQDETEETNGFHGDSEGDVNTEKKASVPDGGWGWMVVFGCSFMHFLLGGYSRSFAVTYVEIREKFGSSAAITSWIGGINVGLRFFLGPLATSLSVKWGVRPVVMTGGIVMALFSLIGAWAPNEYFLFFSYSFGTALGGTLIYAPALILVNQYFDNHRSVATGLASAGSGLGVFVFPPLIKYLFNNFGFTGAFIILSSICLNNCVAGALYRPLPSKKQVAVVKKKVISEKSSNCGSMLPNAWRWINKHFGLSYLSEAVFGTYCLSMTLITLSYVSGHQLIVDLAKEQGVPDSKAVFLLSVIGITDTMGRLLSGFVFDFPFFRPRRQLYYCVSVFLSGGLLFGLGFSKDYLSFVLCSAFQGFFNGVVVCQRAVVIVDIVGMDKLSACFGLCVACQGFGVVFGPMIAGLLKDIYGSYVPSYIFVGSSCMAGGLMLLYSALRHQLVTQKAKKAALTVEVT
ncbi:hypothetical protein CAPTEDRAFT_93436 [Capitella teleta]|uniref:Major facilitator superfamily (MFS) profile domain-containing protein n=1 Tax=Capitella teleta TaxID=283909 RepID=R7VEN9_CAPTE|nr:hypothetical protein CAPTEDRAFT_93436 [Capitella teleta]|eukprot:ELU17303.1 hypothetical protein CAPTEDRAFT_93436 [Capitella teleta]